jgi:cytochrome c oxidase subunit 2
MRLWVILAGSLLLVVGCATPQASANDLPAGDASRGAALFKQSINGAPECASCHTTDGTPLTGPSFKGFSATAGTRINGLSARDYAYQSITNPPAYVVSGFSNLMYSQYAQRLTPQQIADLMAYLLSL